MGASKSKTSNKNNVSTKENKTNNKRNSLLSEDSTSSEDARQPLQSKPQAHPHPPPPTIHVTDDPHPNPNPNQNQNAHANTNLTRSLKKKSLDKNSLLSPPPRDRGRKSPSPRSLQSPNPSSRSLAPSLSPSGRNGRRSVDSQGTTKKNNSTNIPLRPHNNPPVSQPSTTPALQPARQNTYTNANTNNRQAPAPLALSNSSSAANINRRPPPPPSSLPSHKWMTRDVGAVLNAGEPTLFRCVQKSRWTKCSALYTDEATAAENYWTIRIEYLDETAFVAVGVSNQNRLKKGWESSGLLYGGHLSDGLSAVKANFGPGIQAGDAVGVLVSYHDKKHIQIFFFLNGRCLGLAYNLPTPGISHISPMVIFIHGGGSARIQREKNIPDFKNRKRTPPQENFSGIEGQWRTSPGTTSRILFYNIERMDVIQESAGGQSRKYKVYLTLTGSFKVLCFTWEQLANGWRSSKAVFLGPKDSSSGSGDNSSKLSTFHFETLEDPDTIRVDERQGTMSVDKGKEKAKFLRRKENLTVQPITVDPFYTQNGPSSSSGDFVEGAWTLMGNALIQNQQLIHANVEAGLKIELDTHLLGHVDNPDFAMKYDRDKTYTLILNVVHRVSGSITRTESGWKAVQPFRTIFLTSDNEQRALELQKVLTDLLQSPDSVYFGSAGNLMTVQKGFEKDYSTTARFERRGATPFSKELVRYRQQNQQNQQNQQKQQGVGKRN